MAEPFDTLIQVQLHDTTLDQLRHRIETLPERAELRELQRRQAVVADAVSQVQSQVDALSARQRALEEQIASTARRRHEIEHRMESGDVSASRDLLAMDQEVHHLEARQAVFEEEEIALLEEEEPLDVILAEHNRTSAALVDEITRLGATIAGAETEIRTAVVIEEAERKEVAARLPDDLAERYETLRSRLGGVGAARLVGDHCDGCHLTLSSVEVERIRRLRPEEPATCPECDRILVH
jgi:predicted  nucleic acid-binding Zn-ribbon protein